MGARLLGDNRRVLCRRRTEVLRIHRASLTRTTAYPSAPIRASCRNAIEKPFSSWQRSPGAAPHVGHSVVSRIVNTSLPVCSTGGGAFSRSAEDGALAVACSRKPHA